MQPQQNVSAPNQMVGQILWQRVDTLTEQEVDVFDRIVTPETYPILVKLFPEMEALFQQASMFDQMGGPPPSPHGQPWMPSALGAVGNPGGGMR